MITAEELLHTWHSRKDHIIIDTVELSEQEVYFTASVLRELKDVDTMCLTNRQVLERCRQCYRSRVTPGVCANSITILNDTYKEIL